MAAKFMKSKTEFMNTRMLLFNAVAMPEHSQLEYWMNSQKESGFPPIHFCNLLMDRLLEFQDQSTLAPNEINSLFRGVKSLFNVFRTQIGNELSKTVLMN